MATLPLDPARDGAQTELAGSELARVEADIARTRERVSRSVSALRQAVVRRTDWREWVRQRPGLFVAAAFALGFIWGRRSPRVPDRRLNQSRRTGSWK